MYQNRVIDDLSTPEQRDSFQSLSDLMNMKNDFEEFQQILDAMKIISYNRRKKFNICKK
jgi:uncharacterized protein YozE (UPF0346 family)